MSCNKAATTEVRERGSRVAARAAEIELSGSGYL